MIEIGVSRLAKRFAVEPVFTDITFDIKTGEKLGMVGSNGTGKTTIFRIIRGLEEADAGDISLRKGCTIGYLQQEPGIHNNETAAEVIFSAFSEQLKQAEQLRIIEKKLENAQGAQLFNLTRDYGILQTDFEHNGGYDIEVEFAIICSGLQINDNMKKQQFEQLSGGEKTRVMLAKILLEKPDILLLDEPTNHLDIASSEWLEEYLSNYEGAALIISHDRYFLDKAVTGIIEIEAGKAYLFKGNYTKYVQEKEQRLLAAFENFKNIQKKIKAMKAAAERFRIWGRINPDNSAHFARAKKLEVKIEELEQIDKPQDRFKIKMEFGGSKRSGNDVVIAKKLSKNFGDKALLRNADFLLKYGERLAFIGPNGSGKSTFFRMVLGRENADQGTIKLGSSILTGLMEQEIEFNDVEATVLDTFRGTFAMYEGEARNILAKFLFRKDDVYKKISALSGGEKVRLRICFLMQSNLNFLMLDEPTNHLDIESKEMIEGALQNFKGTILFISHDRYFINKIADSIVVLEDHKLKRYPGNYDYYRDKTKNKDNSRKQKLSPKVKTAGTRKVNPQIMKQLETEIAEIEKAMQSLHKEMEFNNSDYVKLMELQHKFDEYQHKLDILLIKWEELLENN